MIIKLNWMPVKSWDAFTVGTLIFVRPSHANDKALIEHEKVHVEQFKRDWLMGVKYLCSKQHRLNYEVEAYCESIKHGESVEFCAWSLTHNYGLDITFEEAVEHLIKKESD